MQNFRHFNNGRDLFIGVDFGSGQDFAVEIIGRITIEGKAEIVSCNRIGRSCDMTKEVREQKCKEYERLCENETVEQKSN